MDPVSSATKPQDSYWTSPSDERLRVVVLDDQRTLRALLGAAFDREGFAHLITDSWAEASSAIFQQPPHVFVLDLNMPALPGERLAPIIRRYLPDARIVIYSGESDERRAKALISTGADEMFHKGEVENLVNSLRATQRELFG